MDACEQLKRDLRDALDERDRELDLARRRFWLGLLGLDFVLDWEERGAVDRAVSGFLTMVQTGEVVLGLQELYRILRGRWEEEEVNVRRRYRARIRELRSGTECPDPDRIFSELGIAVP